MGCDGLSWAWGGMGEKAVIKDYSAQPAPDSTTEEQVTMIERAAVALYGVDRGAITAGSTALVSGGRPDRRLDGSGGQGRGASTIIVSEPNPNRRRIIREIAPYTHVVDPRSVDLPTIVADLNEEGVGVDVALECVGLEASLNACAQAVRRQGKVVQVGLHMKPASIDAMLWALKDIMVEATWCYPTQIWPRIRPDDRLGRRSCREGDHRPDRWVRRRRQGIRGAPRPDGRASENDRENMIRDGRKASEHD